MNIKDLLSFFREKSPLTPDILFNTTENLIHLLPEDFSLCDLELNLSPQDILTETECTLLFKLCYYFISVEYKKAEINKLSSNLSVSFASSNSPEETEEEDLFSDLFLVNDQEIEWSHFKKTIAKQIEIKQRQVSDFLSSSKHQLISNVISLFEKALFEVIHHNLDYCSFNPLLSAEKLRESLKLFLNNNKPVVLNLVNWDSSNFVEKNFSTILIIKNAMSQELKPFQQNILYRLYQAIETNQCSQYHQLINNIIFLMENNNSINFSQAINVCLADDLGDEEEKNSIRQNLETLFQTHDEHPYQKVFNLRDSTDSVDLFEEENSWEDTYNLHTAQSELAWLYYALRYYPGGIETLYQKLGKEMPTPSNNPNSLTEALYDLVNEPLFSYTEEDINNLAFLNQAKINNQPLDPEITKKYCIMQFRGICYKKIAFSHETKILHREGSSNTLYSSAVIKLALKNYNANSQLSFLSLEDFYKNQTPSCFNDYLQQAALTISQRLAWLNTSGPIVIKEKTYPSYLIALYELFINNYEGFMQLINEYKEEKITEKWSDYAPILDAFKKGNGEGEQNLYLEGVPFLSTSDTPHHPSKYAGGLKLYAGHSIYRPLPRWDDTGKALNPYLGKISITMHDLEEYNLNPVICLSTLTSHANLNLQVEDEILTERETTFLGYIPPEKCIYEENVRVPSLKEWKECYLIKYGLTQEKFNYIKERVQKLNKKYGTNFNLDSHINSLAQWGFLGKIKSSSAIQANPGNTFCNYKQALIEYNNLLKPLLFYMEINLIKKAQIIAKSYDKKVIYLDENGLFSLNLSKTILKEQSSLSASQLSEEDFIGSKPKQTIPFLTDMSVTEIVEKIMQLREEIINSVHQLTESVSEQEDEISDEMIFNLAIDANEICQDIPVAFEQSSIQPFWDNSTRNCRHDYRSTQELYSHEKQLRKMSFK